MTSVIDNALKRALKAGHRTAGAWLQLCSPIAAEIMADAGFDWLLVDMEHGHGDYQTLLAQLQAIEGSGVTPLVRVQGNDALRIVFRAADERITGLTFHDDDGSTHELARVE